MQMSAIPANLDSGGLAYKRTARFRARPFDPHPLLRNPHLATVAAAYWPRDFARDRKSTRLNSSHGYISYAVFCLEKKDDIGFFKRIPHQYLNPTPAHHLR